MKAIFEHELSSYFNSVTGYVLGTFILLFAGIYTMVLNLQGGYPNFEYVLSSIAFIFLVGIPILTMRVISEEKKQKTDQLLYALPLTMTKVVLGEYFAMLVILVIPLAIMSIYPLILSAFGNVFLPSAFAVIIAFFFLGATLISMGLFISSLTESQAVAAGLCFVFMLLNYFISSLADFVSTSAFASFVAIMLLIIALSCIIRLLTKSGLVAMMTTLVLGCMDIGAYLLWSEKFMGLFPEIITHLSVFDRFYSFVNGIFDLTAIMYFITVIGVFIFLTVQSLEKRRWN